MPLPSHTFLFFAADLGVAEQRTTPVSHRTRWASEEPKTEERRVDTMPSPAPAVLVAALSTIPPAPAPPAAVLSLAAVRRYRVPSPCGAKGGGGHASSG